MAYLETTNNQNERGTILGVLAGRGDESIVTELLTRVLNGDYSTDESYRVVASALGNPSAQDKAWGIISADFETLLSRLPEIRKPQLAGTTGYFCSIRKAADVEAFFQENATLIPGYERSLAQGVERASLCSALRAQRALDVKNVFKK